MQVRSRCVAALLSGTACITPVVDRIMPITTEVKAENAKVQVKVFRLDKRGPAATGSTFNPCGADDREHHWTFLGVALAPERRRTFVGAY